MPSYWKRALAFAWANTKTFAPWKAIPTVLAAFARWHFGSRGPVRETILIAVTAASVYALCHLVDFMWKLLIIAPVELDRLTQAHITNLQGRLEAPKVSILEQQRRDLVRQKLEDIPPKFREISKRVLVHLLHYGEVDSIIFGISPFNEETHPNTVFAAIEQAAMRDLIAKIPGGHRHIAVRPELKDALIFHLLTGS